MPFKPDYYQERASRERVKKKQEKLRQREEASAQRGTARENAADEIERDCEAGPAPIASLEGGKG
jgi:hypothetical protein